MLQGKVLLLIEWLLLLAGLALPTLTDVYQPYVLAALACLVISFLIRWLRTRQFLPHTGLELPLGLFLATAVTSLYAAYDRPLALLQIIRFIAAAVLFYALVASSENLISFAAFAFLVAAAVLAAYWPLQHDFSLYPGKFDFITSAGLWLNDYLPALPGPHVHANIGAGTLILAVPFGVGLALIWLRQRFHLFAGIAVLLTLVILAGLLMTSSRGAWLGLAGAGGLAGLAWAQRRWLPGRNAQVLYWGGLTVLGLAALGGLSAAGWLDRLLGQIPDPNGSLVMRPALWRQALPLAQDYFFTGLGLMNFPMVFSTYGILIHVFYLSHIHNTYLEILLEQGVGGALIFAWLAYMVASWAWRGQARRSVPILGWAGLAALTAVALQGLVDVTLYLNRPMPLIGLATACAYLVCREEKPRVNLVRDWLPGLVAVGAAVILLAGVWVYPPLRAAWHANLGAVEQTQRELPVYVAEGWGKVTLDQLRQRLDLSQAEAQFEQALSLDPTNPTANQRLTHLALARGKYEQALAQMQAVWDAGRRDEVTRLLYADALVANARPESAAEIVRGMGWAEGRLMLQAYYRYWLSQDYLRCADAWRAVQLLNPQNTQAEQGIQQVLDKIKQENK